MAWHKDLIGTKCPAPTPPPRRRRSQSSLASSLSLSTAAVDQSPVATPRRRRRQLMTSSSTLSSVRKSLSLQHLAAEIPTQAPEKPSLPPKLSRGARSSETCRKNGAAVKFRIFKYKAKSDLCLDTSKTKNGIPEIRILRGDQNIPRYQESLVDLCVECHCRGEIIMRCWAE